MMDNRIEEMANDLQEAWTAWSLSKDLKTPYAFVADILAKKWHPKIPEGAVVLTREDYDYLIKDCQRWESLAVEKVEEINKTRKETAEKFAERLTKLYTGLTPVEEATGYTSIKELLEMINAVAKEITEGEV